MQDTLKKRDTQKEILKNRKNMKHNKSKTTGTRSPTSVVVTRTTTIATPSMMSSPGGRKVAYARRKWSPHQAQMNRRKSRDEDDAGTLNDSFGTLALSDLHADLEEGDANKKKNDDDEDDYLTKSLSLISTDVLATNNNNSSLSSFGSPVGNKNKIRRGRRRPGAPPLAGSSPITTEGKRKKKISSNSRTSKSSNSAGSLANLPSGGSKVPASRNQIPRSRNGSGKSVCSTASTVSTRTTKTKEELMAEIPKEIQQKLYIITDPTIPIRDRVKLQIQMMEESTGTEKRILRKFKHNFDRKMFFEYKVSEDDQHEAQIQATIRKESIKEQDFQTLLQKKRQQEHDEERAQAQRAQNIEDQARHHKAQIIADDMTKMKDAALVAATVTVERNQQEKQQEAMEQTKIIDDFRQGEGKTMMYDAQRALKEAILEQNELPSEKKKKKKSMRKKEKKKKQASTSSSSSKTRTTTTKSLEKHYRS